MIKIPYTDQKTTYRDFDLMMTLTSGRNNLLAGKTINTGIRNTITLFAEGIIMILLALLMPLLIPNVDKIVGNIFIGFGIIIIVVNLILLSFTIISYRQTIKLGPVKADLIFDENGLHAWETPEKGFDADWEAMTNCFVTKKYIFILFKNRHLIVDVPYTRENKEKVFAALQSGYRLSIVKFLAIDKGKITVRNR